MACSIHPKYAETK
jgi:hypothetical protein